jgi:hypothetical protein
MGLPKAIGEVKLKLVYLNLILKLVNLELRNY